MNDRWAAPRPPIRLPRPHGFARDPAYGCVRRRRAVIMKPPKPRTVRAKAASMAELAPVKATGWSGAVSCSPRTLTTRRGGGNVPGGSPPTTSTA